MKKKQKSPHLEALAMILMVSIISLVSLSIIDYETGSATKVIQPSESQLNPCLHLPDCSDALDGHGREGTVGRYKSILSFCILADERFLCSNGQWHSCDPVGRWPRLGAIPADGGQLVGAFACAFSDGVGKWVENS